MWSSAYSAGVRASMIVSNALKSIAAYYNVAGPDVHPPAPHLRELPFARFDDRLRRHGRPSRAWRAIGQSRRCGKRSPIGRAPPPFFPRSDPMNRRAFLQSATAAALAQSFALRAALAQDGWRTFETVTRVDVTDAFGVARAWVPLPLEADTNWQKTIGSSWSGNATQAQVMHDGKYGISMLYTEWPAREASPVIEVTSRFMTRDRAVDFSRPDSSLDLSA